MTSFEKCSPCPSFVSKCSSSASNRLMKKTHCSLIVSLFVTVLQSSVQNLHAEVRTFTSTAGTMIRGELDTINGDMVTIKKEDGTLITTRAANFSAADQTYLKEHGLKPTGGSSVLASATKDRPFVNSLGMKFVPVPGTDVLFCTTLTRVKDWNTYVAATPGTRAAKPPPDKKEGIDTLAAVPSWEGVFSWNESKAFCDWLSKKDGVTYRLPTDREWSVAVGIGNLENKDATPVELNGKLANVYPWGSQWPPPNNFGNYADESFRSFCKRKNISGFPTIEGYKDGYVGFAPVQAFPANKLGIYGMTGTVCEWCEDWYDAAKTKRCIRGADLAAYKESVLLSSGRQSAAPDYVAGELDKITGPDVSFRCVVELPKP